MTENLLAKCVHRATLGMIEFLFERTDPTQITEKVLISAIRNHHFQVQDRVAEKSLHVPITIDVLQSAAEYGSSNLFRFLWNRCRITSVSEDLINAAAKYQHWTPSKGEKAMEFLLHEPACVEIGKETMMAVVANKTNA